MIEIPPVKLIPDYGAGTRKAEVVKHGSHDQSSHGHRGGGATAPTREMSDKEKEVRQRLTILSKEVEGDQVAVTARYQTPDGREVVIRAVKNKRRDQEFVPNPNRPEITADYTKGIVYGNVTANGYLRDGRAEFAGFIEWQEMRMNGSSVNQTLGIPTGNGEIIEASTQANWRRQGVATAMLSLARDSSNIPISHSKALTDDGKAFSSVSKHGNHDQSTHGHRGATEIPTAENYPKEAEYVADYQNQGYARLNQVLRASGKEGWRDKRGGFGKGWDGDTVEALDHLIEISPPSTSQEYVYRGLSHEMAKKLRQGEYLQDYAFLSTSTNPDVGLGFGEHGGVVMRIRVPEGIKSLDCHTFNGDMVEYEKIFARGTVLDLRKVQWDDNLGYEMVTADMQTWGTKPNDLFGALSHTKGETND